MLEPWSTHSTRADLPLFPVRSFPESGRVFAAREYGASLIGNLMLTWFARNAIESDARRAIILGLCVYDAIGFVITLISQITGVLGPLGWFAMAIYLFFAIGFGYFLLPQKKVA